MPLYPVGSVGCLNAALVSYLPALHLRIMTINGHTALKRCALSGMSQYF